MEAIEHLAAHAWRHPSDYAGFSPDGDYLILSRHRESGSIARSNWAVACDRLRAEAWDSHGLEGRPAAFHWLAGHPLVGWVEHLCVRADAPDDILQAAGEIVCGLEDYPILSDDHHSELEWNEITEWWARESVRWRAEAIRESRADVSIFAARRDEFPSDPDGRLYEHLRD